MSVIDGALVAFIVVAWVLPNNRDVARVSAQEAPPVFHAFCLAMYSVFTIAKLAQMDWVWAGCYAIAAAMCARVLWHWWRRRRQGRKSRVLGLVRNLGHRLTVVPVGSDR